MPKRNKKEYLRENVRTRVYIRDREEVFEVHSDYIGKTLLEYQKTFPLGETAADFLYVNFEKLNEFAPFKNMLEFAEFAVSIHPYFTFLKQTVYQNKDDIKIIIDELKTYEKMRDDLSKLIAGCLNAKQNSENAPRFNHYIAERGKGIFTLADRLEYGKTVSEFEAAEGFWALPDEDMPYPLVPPVERLSKGNRPMRLFEVLYPKTLPDLLRFLTAQYLNSDVSFRACKNCGRFFAVTGGSKAEYCNRPAFDSEKTCRQIGSMRAYEKKKSENPVSRIYTKAYKTHNARIRYGMMTKGEFEVWSVKARDMRDKCFAGEITLSEFEDWLKE